MKRFSIVIIPLAVAIVTLLILFLTIPKAESRIRIIRDDSQNQKESVHFVAVGDSLTEGVGDETERGGYVPLVADALQQKYELASVEKDNYGVSGERSDQILKRIKKDSDLKNSLKSADFITMTVGGNDLFQAFQKNLTAKKAKQFNRSIEKYGKHVSDILAEIRELNAEAPIYVVGIYNPYYLNFPDIKAMQTVVDNWNEKTQSLTAEASNCFFVPVNDLLYKGIATKDSQQTENSSSEVKNNVLYDKDNFHPNNLGYQLMANAIQEKIVATKDLWLIKESN
ncbi:SGNH/GDSL hydrolase family protein [Enterococcus xiangfangensis]|uniref:SGNH/GDSL hydrolase family protein n=1 Tax=Enterococcus xiangfangensis TaxID=1296537 RepID=A0ABU3F9N6_9ENTE|nr:SGNH/GDSL hydrolase family protein [Enterococcus xiangfangensis]MDT2759393.1 SGNH/GDSL hydrolase family protein [Enterococcus xiangfangensis]